MLLRPDTADLWAYLSKHPALAGFVLVGGSALTLRIAHRISEDLNFCWLAPRLPRARLQALVEAARASGFHFIPHDDPGSVDEFEIAGMDLRDYQQDYTVNSTVKVSFFTADDALGSSLKQESDANPAAVRVATLDELYVSKWLVAASRSKTRDWFDLFIMMKQNDYSLKTAQLAFAEHGLPAHFDLALQRLCSGIASASDEGYQHLIQTPPTLSEMTQYFREQRDRFEQEEASRSLVR